MQTIVDDDMIGTLIVTDKYSNEDHYLDFPVITMPTWYPLSMNYQVAYSALSDNLYILLHRHLVKDNTDVNKEVIFRYGITQTQGYSDSPEHAIDFHNTWQCPRVYKDNLYVGKLANSLGIHSWFDSVDEWDLDDDFEHWSAKMHILNKQSSMDYQKQLDERQLFLFLGKTEEERMEKCLKHQTIDRLETYERMGQIYTMLVFMKKIKRILRK